MGLIKLTDKEGIVFIRYLDNRMIRRNKNVILVVTGSTGSGKSFISLRLAELWYNYHFKQPFSINHCCFSIEDVVKLLNTGKLRKGDVIIMEEGGVLLGALDFQTKISKLFTYVLQSFRSMNLCLIINLPHLSMLNKTARMLVHANFTTMGIDLEKKTSTIKPFFHQVNQQTGKIYPKYPRVIIKGKLHPRIHRFIYQIPTKELIKEYEIKKKEFVGDLISDFVDKIEQEDKKKQGEKKPLTEFQEKMLPFLQQGMLQKDIAKKLKALEVKVSKNAKWMRNKGYTWDIRGHKGK